MSFDRRVFGIFNEKEQQNTTNIQKIGIATNQRLFKINFQHSYQNIIRMACIINHKQLDQLHKRKIMLYHAHGMLIQSMQKQT